MLAFSVTALRRRAGTDDLLKLISIRHTWPYEFGKA